MLDASTVKTTGVEAPPPIALRLTVNPGEYTTGEVGGVKVMASACLVDGERQLDLRRSVVICAARQAARFVGVDHNAAGLGNGQRGRRGCSGDCRGGEGSGACAGAINREGGRIVRPAVGYLTTIVSPGE